MAAVRFRCTNLEVIQNYYKLLKTTLTQHNFSGEPWRIYNVDETGMPLDPRKPRVVTKVGTKKVRVMGSGNKHQITVVACGSATKHIIPPMIIFQSKNLKREWLNNEVAGTVYATSDTGWINAPLFSKWFDHFLMHAVPGRPLLLLLDGHSTRYSPDIIAKAMEQNVIIFTLPPHSSQDTKPLDVGVFGPLKHHWSRECHEWMAKNPHKIMSKVHFNSVFSKAWARAAVPTNAVAGFKKVGIHPLNENVIPVYDESCSANSSTSGTVSNNNSSTSGSVSSSNKSTTGTVSNGNNPTSDSPTNSNRSTVGTVSNSNNYDSGSVSNSNIFSKYSSTSTNIFTSNVHNTDISTSNISTRNSSTNASINTSNSTNGFASNKENCSIDNPSLTLSVECLNDDEFRSGKHEFVNEETYNNNSSNGNNNNDDNSIMKNIFTT